MSAPEPDERITDLEVKLAFVEEHIAQQDREIVALRGLLDKQTAELKKLRDAMEVDGMNVRDDERPPHY